MRTFDLEKLAVRLLREKGFQTELSQSALKQLQGIKRKSKSPQCDDLRSLLWCSIDNDDSRDLDQLTYAERKPDGGFVIWVAIADVDALVPQGSPIDKRAEKNTTSIYTPARIFPMLPEKLSTHLTSLNPGEERLAIVVQCAIDSEGACVEASIFQACVHNYAQLTYSAIGSWLEKKSGVPEKVLSVDGLSHALLCQHEVAQILRARRHKAGALTLETLEAEARVINKQVVMHYNEHNYAHQLIEEFMIAANSAMALHFKSAKIPGLRRVVRTPKRWDRIVEVAGLRGTALPQDPDPVALELFLKEQKNANPDTFPDLSLTIIKLLGRGEYVVEIPGDAPIGHFGLALREYMHSTAPNRRFPDLISQRICKGFLKKGTAQPYSIEELHALAEHCTLQEDKVIKIERHLNKSAAAIVMAAHIGKVFSGLITGASSKGTWVRIFDFPVEGKIVAGSHYPEVGDRVLVRLKHVDVAKGYIDFELGTA